MINRSSMWGVVVTLMNQTGVDNVFTAWECIHRLADRGFIVRGWGFRTSKQLTTAKRYLRLLVQEGYAEKISDNGYYWVIRKYS